MKKSRIENGDADLLPSYDFSKAVRDKYAGRYAEGSNVVILPPDLAKAFPTSAAVQEALRGLIDLARRTTKKSSPKRSPE